MSDDRQPLVLVPGLSCDATLFAAQVSDLADVAQTSVGDTLKDDTIPAMAARILGEAPDRFALAGFSMGGYVAMEMLRQAPGRITRIAFLGTNAGPDSPDQRRLREAAITTARSRGYETVIRGSRSQLVHDDTGHAIAEAVIAMALRVGLETYAEQLHAIMERPDSRGDLRAIEVPALVLCGAQDRMTPPHYSQEIAALVPHARLCAIDNCGHMAPMEKPGEVNAALRAWLGT